MPFMAGWAVTASVAGTDTFPSSHGQVHTGAPVGSDRLGSLRRARHKVGAVRGSAATGRPCLVVVAVCGVVLAVALTLTVRVVVRLAGRLLVRLVGQPRAAVRRADRSEEPTSELQSLLRTSYAV